MSNTSPFPFSSEVSATSGNQETIPQEQINTALYSFFKTGSEKAQNDPTYLMGVAGWFDGTCFAYIAQSHRDIMVLNVLQQVYDKQNDQGTKQFMIALRLAFKETISQGILHKELLFDIISFAADNEYYELADMVAEVLPLVSDLDGRRTLMLGSIDLIYESPTPSKKLVEALLVASDRPMEISAQLIVGMIRCFQGKMKEVLDTSPDILPGLQVQLATLAKYPHAWDKFIRDITIVSGPDGIPVQVQYIIDTPYLQSVVTEMRSKGNS